MKIELTSVPFSCRLADRNTKKSNISYSCNKSCKGTSSPDFLTVTDINIFRDINILRAYLIEEVTDSSQLHFLKGAKKMMSDQRAMYCG